MRFCVQAVPGDGWLMAWAFTHPLKDVGPSHPFQMSIPGTGEVYRDVGAGEGGISAITTAPYLQKISQTWLILFSSALLKLFHQQSDYHSLRSIVA